MTDAEATLPLRSHDEAILVLGPYDRHAKLLRQSLDIELFTRSGNLRIRGQEKDVEVARTRIEHLLGKHRKGRELQPREIEEILLEGALQPEGQASREGRGPRMGTRTSGGGREDEPSGTAPWRRNPVSAAGSQLARGLRPRAVQPRSQNQRRYLEAMEQSHLAFGLGAAGTGKTYLAAAAAVHALRSGQARRLIVTRPVVEAGERLGFLPGDLQAKLDPYMRPVYDALYDLLSFEEVQRLEETGVLEVAPLAYMRGRTLASAFVLLDEAQNTTVAQMKMFLTRLGEGSKMVVTGDPSQTDLDSGKTSGLSDAVRRLRGFAGVSVVEFSGKDIVRHPLVEQIVRAYEGPAREGSGRESSVADGESGDRSSG